MNKKTFAILSPLLAFVIYLTCTSSSGGITGRSTIGCGGGCHALSANPATVITLTGLPSSGYSNGVVYSLTLSITNSGVVGPNPRDGFDLTSSAGSFTAIAGTATNGPLELFHTTPKVTVSGTATWTFNWTAPATGSATITFNAAGNATNGDGSNNAQDIWNFFSTTLIKNPVTPLSVTATSTTIACNGGTSTITATGANGVTPYQYRLNAGTYQTGNTFAGNLAGTYTITVKDAVNNTASTLRTITQPSIITFSAGTVTNPLCNGGTGSASKPATGGTGTSKTYTITPLGPQSNTTGNFTNLTAQTYTVTVSDANACTKTTTFTITQPPLLTFTTNINNPSCFGGTGTVASPASGGTGTITYSITPLGPQTNTVGNFTGLTPQNYTISVVDANNCTKSTVITITQPPVLAIAPPTITNAICNGGTGSASIVASGGTGAYSYSWNNVVSTSLNLVANKDNTIFEQNVNNSDGAGPHMYAGKLANGFRNRGLIRFDLSSIPTTATIDSANLTLYCSKTAPAAGVQPINLHKLTQDWGEGTSNSGSPGGTGAPASTNDATWINRLHPGTAWTTVGGSFNATSSASTFVDEIGYYNWSSAGILSDIQSWVSNSATNFGWLIKGQETANGQAKRFDSRTNDSLQYNPSLQITYSSNPNTATQNNMPAGNYIVTVKDANNCTLSTSLSITEPPPTIVTADNAVGCIGLPVTLSGSPAGGTFSVANPYTGPSTTFTYTYTDGNGCSTTSSPASITMNTCGSAQLNIKLFYQGFYTGSSTMIAALLNQGVGSSSTDVDTIMLELNDTTTFVTDTTLKAVLQTDGTASFSLGSYSGSYYLAIKHRNGLTTWSANPVSLSTGTNLYDFTTAANKAYGDNMKEVESGIWAFYAGDLNYDDNIDLLDLGVLEVDISNFEFGYKATDLNGDGNVDLLDSPVVEDNVTNFIFSSHP